MRNLRSSWFHHKHHSSVKGTTAPNSGPSSLHETMDKGCRIVSELTQSTLILHPFGEDPNQQRCSPTQHENLSSQIQYALPRFFASRIGMQNILMEWESSPLPKEAQLSFLSLKETSNRGQMFSASGNLPREATG